MITACGAKAAPVPVPHLLWCFHGTVVSFRDVVVTISRPIVSGIAGGLLAFGVLFVLGPSLSPFARLVLGGTLFVAVYVPVLLFVMRQKTLYLDLLDGWRSSFRLGRVAVEHS